MLREAKQEVPADLLKFDLTVRKKVGGGGSGQECKVDKEKGGKEKKEKDMSIKWGSLQCYCIDVDYTSFESALTIWGLLFPQTPFKVPENTSGTGFIFPARSHTAWSHFIAGVEALRGPFP